LLGGDSLRYLSQLLGIFRDPLLQGPGRPLELVAQSPGQRWDGVGPQVGDSFVQVSDRLEGVGVPEASGAQLEAISFREQAIDLKLIAPDAQSIEALTQSLRRSGWQAELTAGSARGERYEGRVQLRRAGA
jgi:hypothetical protein